MRQRRWLELFNDYDCDVLYHLGKANKVEDALSRQSMAYMMTVREMPLELQGDMSTLELEVVVGKLANLSVQSTIMEAIQGGQLLEPLYEYIKHEVRKDMRPGFHISEDGVLGFKGRIFVPKDTEIKNQIFYEAHNAPYAMHPGTTKIYQDLRKYFWWPKMKKEVAKYKAHYLTCQQTKIVRLHGVPNSIISDRDGRFTLTFWKMMQEGVGTQLNFGTAFHPQTDSQKEVDKVTEDIKKIRERLQTSINQHRKYVDQRRRPLAFEVGDTMPLKVALFKGALLFGKKRKLSPRYIGPFEIVEKISMVAYRLALPPALA
ncbi:uncharacterized protein LOC133828971 [Humulus lupulus]|uniref:uncharacterized protein LOC133828971 n=1 Tax=Humulus lupulus TaxID=3486 RepID=UPI002B405899|nr:uncharacterized protein LOC133828971 [Humulus lupulus]